MKKYNSRSGYLPKLHEMLHLPRKVTLQLHQTLRKTQLMNDPRHIWTIISNARSVRYSSILYASILCTSILYASILYASILYASILYSSILYSSILYSSILYASILSHF